MRNLMKRPNQSIVFALARSTQLSAVAPLVHLVLGGCLALAAGGVGGSAPQNPAQASPLPGDVLIAQKVAERLPPPPSPIKFGQDELPSRPDRPREFDFRAPLPNRASPNFESYLVYTNETSSTRLQEVQQLEPTAFVRQYKGRPVIQAGVFNQKVNAEQRAKELKSRGIGVRIVSLATGQETDIVNNSKYYFVVIPASQKDLPLIESQVTRLRKDVPVSVSQRKEPRGSHVRVGPFPQRRQAERWNRYLLDFGLKNARVYYGR